MDFLEMVTQDPAERDISDPAQSTPVSKHHFTGLLLRAHDCAFRLPPTHPAILATGSEAGAKPSHEVGAAGGSSGRWV